MPSYVVFGASRGIGLEFVRQLSQDENNQVIAIARNPQTSPKFVELEKATPNIRSVKGDLLDVTSLKAAAEEVGKLTGGSLDYLINNAAFVSGEYAGLSLTDFPDEDSLERSLTDTFRTNVVGVTHTINAFLPLLRAGTARKVITLSTGVADTSFILRSGFSANPQYAISKAALNMAVAEFAARLEDEGFTFVAISPGLVNTAENPPTPEELKGYKSMVAKFKRHSPDWNGVPLTPEASVKLMLSAIDKVEPKDSGAFISQYGNQQWL